MTFFSKGCTTTKQNPDIPTNKGFKLGKNQSIHNWCIITSTEPSCPVANTKINQLCHKWPTCIDFAVYSFGAIHILRKHFFTNCNIFTTFFEYFPSSLYTKNLKLQHENIIKCNVEKEILLFWQKKNPVFVKKLEVTLNFVLCKCIRNIWMVVPLYILSSTAGTEHITDGRRIVASPLAPEIRFKIKINYHLKNVFSIFIHKYTSNKIRRKQNEHMNIFCQNLNCLYL